jgi:hypothetical protein
MSFWLRDVELSGCGSLGWCRGVLCLLMGAFTHHSGQKRASSSLELHTLHQPHTRHDTMEYGLLPTHEVSTFPTLPQKIAPSSKRDSNNIVSRERHLNLPIYTLRLPGIRLYVINSLDLIPVVQRQWRTLIFGPIQVKAAHAAMGASKDAIAIMENDLITENGFINGMVKATQPTMSNGPGLDALNAKAFEVFNEAFKQFAAPTTATMFGWIGKQIMRATTDALYGPFNPMRDVRNLEAWQLVLTYTSMLQDVMH